MSPQISVLVVDDEPGNVVALEAALASVDCRLVRAHSGRDALRRVLKQDFAVILLDIRMPIMDGFETARYRSRSHSRATPIIFMTAYDPAGRRCRRATDWVASTTCTSPSTRTFCARR